MMKINNKCRCQYMTKDKKILRNISSQNNFSIKMWVKKETFNNLTILKTIKCIETELDLCHSQDQRCQVDRAINSWIKMATIKGMTEIRWTCKGRMKSTTKTWVNMPIRFLMMCIMTMFIHLPNKKIYSILKIKWVESSSFLNNS